MRKAWIVALLLSVGQGLRAQTLSISPSGLTFGSQTVNTTSASQAVTVTNSGAAAVTLNSIAASAGFAQTNNCFSAPALVDDFNTGVLDTSKWVIDTGGAPGNSSSNSGSFSASYLDLSQSVLALKLTQTGTSPVISTGAELRSVNTYTAMAPTSGSSGRLPRRPRPTGPARRSRAPTRGASRSSTTARPRSTGNTKGNIRPSWS